MSPGMRPISDAFALLGMAYLGPVDSRTVCQLSTSGTMAVMQLCAGMILDHYIMTATVMFAGSHRDSKSSLSAITSF